jgi:hypothetical protein
MMVAAITAAAVMVIVIAVLVGIRVGQSVQADAVTLATTASSVPSPSNTSAVTPAQSPKPTPEPAVTRTLPATSTPPSAEPVVPAPLPEQSFAEVQPLPPVAEAAEELPADPPSPTPKPTCPADNGVTLTLTKAEPVKEIWGSDEFKLTLELNNKIGVPVNLTEIVWIEFTGVRASGEETWAGSLRLAEPWEVPPGRSTLTTDSSSHATTVHGLGSPITAWKLGGFVRVENGTSDQESRGLCEFNPMTYGKPLLGSWGS